VVLAAALLAASALFVIGVAVERSGRAADTETVANPERKEREYTEAGERGREQTPEASEGAERRERLFGVDLESTPVAASAVALAVLLAAAALLTRSRAVVVLIGAVALALAAFDARELIYQIDESRVTVAVTAAAAALAHVVAAGAAAQFARSRTS
jgi:hypothetical protein